LRSFSKKCGAAVRNCGGAKIVQKVVNLKRFCRGR